MPNSFKIAVCQINPTVGDLAGNRKKIAEFYRRAAIHRPDLVVFPEGSLTGYPTEDLLLRKSFIQANLGELRILSREIHEIPALVGFVNQKKHPIYNACALLAKGKTLGTYEKRVLPNYGVFDEERYFQPGNSSGIFNINGVKIGVSICEDLWLDSSANVCREQARSGAQILINLSASPYHAEKLKVRLDLLRRRIKETKLPIVYANLIGGQDELLFDGRSMVAGPKGELTHLADPFAEDILFCEFIKKDRALLPAFSKPLPEPPATDSAGDIYQALVLGTRDYIEKNGFQKVLIGLSGGIDSALVAAISSDAIGKDRVIGVTMPSRFTSKETYADALLLAKNLGIECKILPIRDIHQAFLNTLKPLFAGTVPNMAEENIQSRIRGSLLMALSNKFGHLVLTTGNKSEVSVGYCTLYGDTAGGFAVLKDVPKTLVYRLSEYFNKSRGGKGIPESTIKRAPTAELKFNQKDQDTLPPYSQLDLIIHDYVEDDLGYAELRRKGHPESALKKVIRMIDANEYKRRQSPPGIKITPKAFGRDRRMPITSRFKEY